MHHLYEYGCVLLLFDHAMHNLRATMPAHYNYDTHTMPALITMIRSRTAVYYFKPEYQIYRWHAAHCTSHTTGALHHTTTICITFDENVMLSCLFISSCITQLPFTKNLSNLTYLNLANLAQEQVNSPTTALISQLSKYIID